MRVLGVDPGLTRCGVGVVDVGADRRAALVHVEVVHTSPETPLEQRLVAIAAGVRRVLDETQPDAVALERVFAQQNLHSVMGVAQASGVVLQLAGERGLRVGLHTPSEVKSAVTGYGSADKKQVGAMVARVLGLLEIPRPADAADALALAICHAWSGRATAPDGHAGAGGAGSADGLTPAQRAWRAAEKSAPARRVAT